MFTPSLERIGKTEPHRGLKASVAQGNARSWSTLVRRSPPSRRELARFMRQLATLLEAGVPIPKALEIQRHHSWSEQLAGALAHIRSSVIRGLPLSEGMKLCQVVFDPLTISVVSAGELSGSLVTPLQEMSKKLDRADKIAATTRAALIYPCCVVSVAALVSSFLVIFIIPTFRELFADAGAPLPTPTRVVLEFSELVRRNVASLCAALLAVFFLLRRLFRAPMCREIISRIALRIPIIRKVRTANALARITTSLATALAAGVPILKALEISGKTAGHSNYSRALRLAALEVSEGNSLSNALRVTNAFPSTIIEMLTVGETTGHLDEILRTLAKLSEEDAERTQATAQALLGPLSMSVVGLLVGGLIFALYLPIFSLGQTLR